MTDNVYWLIEASIKEGEIENVKGLMNEMIEKTKADEPGALFYEWSISDDEKTLYLFERYKDSQAVLAHMDSFGKNFASRFMGSLEIRKFQTFGDPNEAVLGLFKNVGAKFNKPLGGFQR
jgi:quinol monooxygenase YgiN